MAQGLFSNLQLCSVVSHYYRAPNMLWLAGAGADITLVTLHWIGHQPASAWGAIPFNWGNFGNLHYTLWENELPTYLILLFGGNYILNFIFKQVVVNIIINKPESKWILLHIFVSIFISISILAAGNRFRLASSWNGSSKLNSSLSLSTF